MQENAETKSRITIHLLSAQSHQSIWAALLEIDREVIAEPWGVVHFTAPRPSKWQLSFYAERAGLISGFVVASKKDNKAHLHRIGVAPGARSQGLGASLLQELAQRARRLGLRQITLKVHLANRRAVRFYEANGFQLIAEASPNLLMGKEL